jgi:hypothetical protein
MKQESRAQWPGMLNGLYPRRWLGGSDADGEGTWKWMTGPENGTLFRRNLGDTYTFTNVQPGYSQFQKFSDSCKPDCASQPNWDYLQLMFPNGTHIQRNQWNDEVASDNEVGAIVEYSTGAGESARTYTTTTDSQGSYAFDGLAPGVYTVQSTTHGTSSTQRVVIWPDQRDERVDLVNRSVTTSLRQTMTAQPTATRTATGTVTKTSTPTLHSNNLLLHLEAENRSSYSGIGTVWNDISGNNNHASIMNGPVFISESPYSRFVFDGINDYVGLPPGFSDFTNGMTVIVVANMGDADYFERLIDFGNGASNNNIYLSRLGTSNDLHWMIYSATNSSSLTAVGGILNNTTAIYAVTVDGSKYRIYRNGIEIASTNTTVKPNNVIRNNNYIGRSNWSADAYYDSSISAVMIYNTALSEKQIYDNYVNLSHYIP